MADLTTRPAATQINAADLFYLHQGGVSKKVPAGFIVDVTKVKGDWDMSVTDVTEVEPDAAVVLEASTVKTDDDNYEMTPAAGASQFKMQGSEGGIRTGSSYLASRVKSPNSGGNLLLAGFAIANEGATEAEIAASLLFGGAVSGGLTHLQALFFPVANFGPFNTGDVGFVRGDADNPSGGSDFASGSGFAFTPGTDHLFPVFARENVPQMAAYKAPGANSATYGSAVSALAVDATTWDVPLRLHTFLYFSSTTPTFTDGTLNFDFSATNSSEPSFVPFTVENAIVPAGARDGDRFRVSVGGPFAGKTTRAEDVVELRDSLSNIYVARFLDDAAIATIVADYLADNPALTFLNTVRLRAFCISVANQSSDVVPGTYSSPLVVGDTLFVGLTPTGDFAGFTFGNMAAWNGTAWVEIDRADLVGVEFIGWDANFQLQTFRQNPFALSSTDYNDGGNLPGAITVADAASAGWAFHKIVKNGVLVTAPSVALSNGGSDFVVLGSAEQFNFEATGNGTFTLNFANGGAASVLVGHINAGGEVANVTIQNFGTVRLDDYRGSVSFFAPANGLPIGIHYADQDTWHDVTAFPGAGSLFAGAWTDVGGAYQACQVRRNGFDVTFRGHAVGGTGGLVFTAPAGYRPAADQAVPVTVITGGVPVLSRAVMGADGTFTVTEPTGIVGAHTVEFDFTICTQAG